MCINNVEHNSNDVLSSKSVGLSADTPLNEANLSEIGVSSKSAQSAPVSGVGATESHKIISVISHKQNQKKWFVLRAVYGKDAKAIQLLKNMIDGVADDDIYNPTYTLVKRVDKKILKERKPYLPGMFFARLTEQQVFGVVRSNENISSRCLDFYRNKTLAPNWNGVHPPMTVSDADLHNFRLVADVECDDVFPTDVQQYNIKLGDRVRITSGIFQGAVGHVARVKGKQRVVVSLDGIVQVATSFVPSFALEVLNSQLEVDA